VSVLGTVGQTVLGCPQVLGILTTDPIANRTPMASQAVAGLFRYWGPAAQTRTSGLPRVEQGPSPSDLCGDPTVPMPGRKRRDGDEAGAAGDRKFCDVCHRGADSRPVTLSASNRGSSSNDQASISTSQAISGAFGRGAVSGCRRQPRHVRVRRQAGCSVPFRRRMVGGQGHLRSHRAGPHPRCMQEATWRSHRRGTAIPGALLRGGTPAGVLY